MKKRYMMPGCRIIELDSREGLMQGSDREGIGFEDNKSVTEGDTQKKNTIWNREDIWK